MSTGVHDPLECAAFYVRETRGAALFIACDLIYFDRDFAAEVRGRIASVTHVPVDAIMLTATHTHSGPVTTNNLCNSTDAVVPKADPAYLRWVSDQIVAAAAAAEAAAEPAELGLAVARADGVGTNRHDPAGPTDPEVPVLVARSIADRRILACMVSYGMHPTVLHEDSTLVSADFPGFTRRWLRGSVLPVSCPVIYHLGAAGNQSPRHLTRANTFAEAQQIGGNLGRCIASAIAGLSSFTSNASIFARRRMVELVARCFPAIEVAGEQLDRTKARFDELRAADAPRPQVRSAECDVFGAEKTAVFARAKADGRLAEAIDRASPAEIQVIQIGRWTFVGWPGEFFVEHGLALKAAAPGGTFLITLANGQLQGYIATPAAVAQGAYEAANSIFAVENGPRFVEQTLSLLDEYSRS